MFRYVEVGLMLEVPGGWQTMFMMLSQQGHVAHLDVQLLRPSSRCWLVYLEVFGPMSISEKLLHLEHFTLKGRPCIFIWEVRLESSRTVGVCSLFASYGQSPASPSFTAWAAAFIGTSPRWNGQG